MRIRGFTLLEMVIATAIFAVVSGGIVIFLHRGQQTFRSQGQRTRSVEQARIALDQMIRYLRHSGNDPFGTMEAGGIPAIEILGSGHIRINSDMTGSVASQTGDPLESTGDPDGTLASIHERVEFRYDSSADELYSDIGYGEGLVVEDISTFELEFFDAVGNLTNIPADIARVRIRLVVRSEDADMATGHANQLSLQSDVFLRSKSFNPLAES